MVMTMCTVGCREERLSLFYIVVVFPLLNETFLSFWYSLFFLSYPPFFLLYLFVNHTRRLDHFIPFPPLIVTFSFNSTLHKFSICLLFPPLFCSPFFKNFILFSINLNIAFGFIITQACVIQFYFFLGNYLYCTSPRVLYNGWPFFFPLVCLTSIARFVLFFFGARSRIYIL